MSDKKRYLCGIDLGTTNVKGIIMDEYGNICAESSCRGNLLRPEPEWVEQDPLNLWEITSQIIRDMTKKAGKEAVDNLKGICISSHVISMLPVDKDGEPLKNALIWMDSRSANEMTEILSIIGEKAYVNIVGGQPSVAFLPSKLLWYKEHEPELLEKTACVLQANGYLNYKLTGILSMDMDCACRCQCMDVNTLKWSEEIGNALGIDLNKILPKPLKTGEIIGSVTEKAAEETGLKAGTPVVAGGCDALASMYATGITKLGEAGESSGTTSLVFIGAEKQSAGDAPVTTKLCAIKDMPFVYDAPINYSGASIQWYLDHFGETEKAEAEKLGISVYDYINEKALDVPAGSRGLFFFPYLRGERAPLWNSHARGMFIGVTPETGRDEFIRAIFEGTAFALRHVVETIKESGPAVSSLRITGGGAKSRTWCQIKASVLHVPVYTLDEKSGEVPFGDALIAGVASGVFPDLTESIKQVVKVNEIIEPLPEWEEAYDKLYPFYIKMYQHLDKDLSELKSVTDLL